LAQQNASTTDNSVSPHGGALIERVTDPERVDADVWRSKTIPVRGQIATEVLSIAYGFFSPLEGFMSQADVDSVAREMRLANGLVWSVPIVFDLSDQEIEEFGVGVGETFLLTHHGAPFATFDVEEIYSYDKESMAEQVYGTTSGEHPGVVRTRAYKEKFLAGKITLVNPPAVNAPFDAFWVTPRELRATFAENGWRKVVAHQTRNVPHVGHEWLMKSAWFDAGADAILANPVIGEKKEGDAIDEAILLGHSALREAGYFKPDVHMTSMLLWDMRYAGPREAVFHALVRKNMGCTHHMFGRDHAGVGSFYDPYAAHRIFEQIPAIGIEPVITLAWSVCDLCGPAYERFCAHDDRKNPVSGTWVRGLIKSGERPDASVFRPEVFDAMLQAGERYGAGTPFVTEDYLKNREPVFTVPELASVAAGT